MSTKMKKVQRVLERRIRHGDYILTGLPPERNLSTEMGASRMTTRKAVEELIHKGLLKRLPNGRLALGDNVAREQITVGLLVPSTSSGDVEQWRLAAERAAEDFNARIRTILYVHWDDPILRDAINGLANVFLIPSAEEMPDEIIEKLSQAGRSLSVLGQDMSRHGLHSVFLFPFVWVQRLLDHLAELGHRTVDCFNVQAEDVVIRGRMEQWQLWRASHRLRGRVLGQGIQSYDSPLKRAYDQMTAILERKELKATALFCTTAPAAIGATRALHDHGIRVGHDISVCAINDEGLARYVCPSLTCIEMPDPTPYLRLCIERMQAPDDDWMGPLLLQPPEPTVFKGESTAPPKT